MYKRVELVPSYLILTYYSNILRFVVYFTMCVRRYIYREISSIELLELRCIGAIGAHKSKHLSRTPIAVYSGLCG